MTAAPIPLFDLPAPLFAHDEPTDPRPEQLKQMHRDYGVLPDKVCGGCVHCSLRPGNTRSYYKCTLYGRYTNGPGTDWRKKWVACPDIKLEYSHRHTFSDIIAREYHFE